MPMATSIGLDQKIGSSVVRMSGRRRRKGILKHSTLRRRLGAGGRKQSLASSSKAVAQRLEALRSLIPQRDSGAKEEAAAAADRLFEETAEYILLLRTKVAVLKRLVDVYSPGITVKNDGDCA
ncbi:hypothetical protein ZIOFF_067269 [Zingiber officinale]|uniref:Uncharacterized protein n=1 Tax=Zingiber officinale TaxID=94328 RepID=A0A8J5CFB3_ZINOF|nr:hypothetical protein ZIOFF_067269 [Zingiber officinale]